ncbi:FAD dependent oxidoreductase-domain-containing protein [Collybia nuda]|uniref:FAD dependent oxidoreductase-domain-containing protein n=1 Tax=Collybia nuda TaxID=64659 RepID=A0A9P6CNE2_9AGAR|nr:FAD dependent oxidoreductase-domain-containing protein [Collybia nuda]
MSTQSWDPFSNVPQGSILSHIRHTLRNLLLRFAVRALTLISPSMDALVKRIQSSPGIPVPKPSIPYWSTPSAHIARHGSDSGSVVPSYADVVIIGSGITGTSFARTLLDYDADHARHGEPLQVVMLEAREACSGATGRNGGHITPVLYAEYSDLKEQYGIDAAKKIIRFRLSHYSELHSIAVKEDLLEVSQCRQVEAFDVFYDSGRFKASKEKLAAYQEDLPCESADYKVYEGPDDMEKLQLSPKAVGCFSTKAGAIHPYRLVTGILSRLLRSYTNSFHLYTETPCTEILSPERSSPIQLYSVMTSRGVIQTPHIIHATNGWISHLLPGMRCRILPARGVMTAQMPWKGLGTTPSNSNNGSSWTGTRSFVFFPGSSAHKYDYLTQQVPSPLGLPGGACRTYPPPMGELMFGGGFSHGNGFLTELGNADDREWNLATGEYLSHALEDYFAMGDHNKGRAHSRVKSTWGGILGISVDQLPWVGRIPEKVSRRAAPPSLDRNLDVKEPKANHFDINGDAKGPIKTYPNYTAPSRASNHLAAPGEWMAAGYTGEGMVHAWMSGKALAYMVLGLDRGPHITRNDTETKRGEEVGLENWFPDVFRVTQERWENIGVEDLFASFMD